MRWISSIFAVIAIIALFIVVAGCEDNSDFNDNLNNPSAISALSITPPSYTMSSDETYLVFTASGGEGPYTWSVSDTSLGTIPVTGANTITYTRKAGELGANVLQVLDGNGWIAQAVITQDESTNSPSI